MKNGKTKIIIGILVAVVVLFGIIIGIDTYKKNIYMEPLATYEAENDASKLEDNSTVVSTDGSYENSPSEIASSNKSGVNEDANLETEESSDTEDASCSENSSVEGTAEQSHEKVPTAIGTYEPSTVYDFCKEQSLSDALCNCTVNQNADYSQELYVDLGEAFPEKYKDIDIDGDGLTDSIIRVIGHTGDGCVYGFEFGNGISFVSSPYTMVPNEGELISFYDFDNDNVDEILITHITDSTGGPLAWNCELYSWNGSGWESQWAVDESGAACLAGVDDVLSQEGKAYNVRDVEFTEDGIMYLIDYGQKNGAELTLDLETIQIKFFGKELYMEERLNADKRDELTNKIWPFGI